MKSIGDPDFVYRPWSKVRRKKASNAAAVRLYGSKAGAAKARAKRLAELLDERRRLKKELQLVESNIRQVEKAIIKAAS